MNYSSIIVLACSVVLGGLPACRPPAGRPTPPGNPRRIVDAPRRPTPEQIIAWTELSFQRAIFYKPREDSMTGLEMTFAPLLVQEVADGGAGADCDPGDLECVLKPLSPPGGKGRVRGFSDALLGPFGAWVAVDGSRARIDSEKPTLYATTVTTAIDGVDHEQVVYVWRYPVPDGGERCISREGRGVRITLGADGLPLVWEALSTDTRTTVLFIAESLEQAARRQFGDPLPGRRFSIERAADETPDVVVTRIIDDGPVPMGPYVYLNAPPGRAVTTVLCRCSPSQVEAFIETRYYDIVPLETLGACSERMRWAGTLVYDESRRAVPGKSLDRILRWPRM